MKLINLRRKIDKIDDKVTVRFTYLYDVKPLGEVVLDPTTYTFSSTSNFQGYIYITLDSYGAPIYYFSIGNVIKFGLMGYGYAERGFANFNITAIPDWAMVSYTSFKYEGQANPGGVNAYIKSLASNPNLRSATEAYSDINAGTLLVDSATFPVVATSQEESLGSVGISQLQSRLSGNWFALGFMLKTEGTSYDKIIRIGAATPAPTLYVEYYLFGTEMGAGEYGGGEIH